jgi:hypothetical protein
MRSVSVRACGAALLLFLVLVTAVPAVADELPPGLEPPQGRIHIPVGLTAEQEEADELALWELLLIWWQGRIHIPGG